MEHEDKLRIMRYCSDIAEMTMGQGKGGPFGAAVISKDGRVISVASNTVLADDDPTAHAEVNAIRKACKLLKTHDLSEYELYATGYPCPMCLSAAIWANIQTIHVSGLPEDAAKIGFRDDFIYHFIENGQNDDKILSIDYLDRDIAQKLYSRYKYLGKEIY